MIPPQSFTVRLLASPCWEINPVIFSILYRVPQRTVPPYPRPMSLADPHRRPASGPDSRSSSRGPGIRSSSFVFRILLFAFQTNAYKNQSLTHSRATRPRPMFNASNTLQTPGRSQKTMSCVFMKLHSPPRGGTPPGRGLPVTHHQSPAAHRYFTKITSFWASLYTSSSTSSRVMKMPRPPGRSPFFSRSSR